MPLPEKTVKSESLDRVSNTASEPESAEAPGARQSGADGVLREPRADPGGPQARLPREHRLRHRLVDQLGEPVGGLAQVGQCLVGLEVLSGLQRPAYGGELVRVRGAVVFERACGRFQSMGVRFEAISREDRARIARFLDARLR